MDQTAVRARQQTPGDIGGALAPRRPSASTRVAVAAVVSGLAVGLAPWHWLAAGLALMLPLIDPVFGACLLILSVTAQETPALPGDVSLTQAAVPLALMGWIIRTLAHPERRLGLGATAVCWAAFLVILLVSASLSPYSATEGLKELWRWGAAFLAWLIVATSIRRPWQIAALLACLLIGPLINAGIGLAQFATGDGPPAFRIDPDMRYVRAYGTIGQPNSFAGYLNMGWPLALALAVGASLWIGVPRPGRSLVQFSGRAALALILWLVAAILLLALGASFSRGAWIGAAIGMLGLLAALGRRGAVAGLALGGGGLALLALGGLNLLPVALASRLASITRVLSFYDPSGVTVTPENFAVLERMAQLWAGWRMFLAHPLLGVGPGSYTMAYQEFASAPWFASRGHAHNYYLHIAAEAGLVGLAAYLALIAAAVFDARRALARTNGLRRAAVVGICGIIAAMAGHHLFENLHVLHLSIQAGAAWGMVAALGRAGVGEED